LVSAFTWAQNVDVTSYAGNNSTEANVAVGGSTGYTAEGLKLVEDLVRDELVVNHSSGGQDLPGNQDRSTRILERLRYGVPPSRFGVPGRESEPNDDDLMEQQYPLNVFLRESLDEAKSLKSIGSRIGFFEGKVADIFSSKGTLNDEAPKLVLNRTVDMVQNVIKWIGRNSELSQQFLVQYYVQGFNVALAYSQNPPYRAEGGFSRADVGIFYSRVIFKNQAGLISNTANGVMLIKLLGYLGQDLNSDLLRREKEYSLPLKKIRALQKRDPNYQRILSSLASNTEPRDSDLAGLRRQISNLFDSLPIVSNANSNYDLVPSRR
jgi:hypothetical protein